MVASLSGNSERRRTVSVGECAVDSRQAHPVRRLILICCGLGAIAAIAWLIWSWSARRPDFVRQAQDALADGRVGDAQALAARALEASPHSAVALITAGEAASKAGHHQKALSYYGRVPQDSGIDAVVAAGAAGDAAVQLKWLSEAERWFRRVLEHDPNHTVAHRRLAAVLVLSGRRREAAAHFEVLLRQGTIEVDELALLGNVELVFDAPDLIEGFRQAAPKDPLPLLGLARIAIRRNELSKAAGLLRQVIDAAPHLAEAQVSLGRVLAETGPAEAFHEWHARISPDLQNEPDLWAARGRWARKTGNVEGAIRCYGEALLRDPNHWRSNHHLSQLLDPELAEACRLRAERLNDLAEIMLFVHLEGATFDHARKAAELNQQLGRLWEAWAWYRAATLLRPSQQNILQARDGLKRQLTPDLPLTLPSANPVGQLDLSRYPLPEWTSTQPAHRVVAVSRDQSSVWFADRAASADLDFAYDNGADPSVAGFRTWQSFGGGVAVLDYDIDGWPDLFFTQACDVPLNPDPSRLDQLFRNIGGGQFANVTADAGVGDGDFGQGAAAGDFDGDGFVDLYVANFGGNRLYHNHGDGTFSDVSVASGISGENWTSSCLIADVNGDGLPDLYDVNYLDFRRHNLLNHFCREEQIGEFRTCPPTQFAAEQDRLYVNLGDGRFEDATVGSGIVVPEGKGLGIVAADFDGDRWLDLYVANDTTPNFYFVNQTAPAGSRPKFEETAVIAGCAYDLEGRAQAGMGIAVDDADGDGLLDLFVTNFYNEYNVLYTQVSPRLFIDRSAEAGLADASVRMLGFGTQFIDGDLDGWPDLVVANGHVDDYRHKSIPFRMEPQYFRNTRDGRFESMPAGQVGDYFSRPLLGRGLARLDWNRDGREDFVVTHVHDPVSLVINESTTTGDFLAVQLRGVVSSRDAIGTIVEVRAGGRTWSRQLTAGDGYYASNQRQLVFGLGPDVRVADLTVHWPSGQTQSFLDLSADREFLLVEGRAEPISLPQP